jgi:hypothetical protein
VGLEAQQVEVEAQQWFWPWGRMESLRAGNFLSVESDLQADAGGFPPISIR